MDTEQDTSDAAAAFAQLGREVTLLRHAVEGLTAAREKIDIPDYEPTLARTEQVLAGLVQRIDAMSKSPAMTMTPENMGARISGAVASPIGELRAHAQTARTTLDEATRDLRGLVASARRGDEQNRWLAGAGIAGAVLGLLLWAALAGPIARGVPESWHWPEQRAARALDMPMWQAGQRLMATAGPVAFRNIVAGDRIVTANRTVIEGCAKTAAKAGEAVRCTISVAAAPQKVLPGAATPPRSGRSRH